MKSPVVPARLACVGGVAFILAASHSNADTLEPLWSIKPGEPVGNPWMTAPGVPNPGDVGSDERSVTVNPLNGHVLVATNVRFSTPADPAVVRVLNGADGTELYQMDVSTVVGGDFMINKVVVADDGTVFACNLTTAIATRTFKLYRWANDDEGFAPELVFDGNPAEGNGGVVNVRWGDTMDVRGSGAGIQIAIGGNTDGTVCILTPGDTGYVSHSVTGVGPSNGMHGIAFGSDITGYDDPNTPANDNLTLLTLYTKRSGSGLRRIGIRTDTWTAVASTLVTFPLPSFPGTIIAIGTHVATNRLGAIDRIAAPQNDGLALYDITAPLDPPVLVERETPPPNNDNGNLAGAVDFYVPPQGQGLARVYFMNTNDGLSAFEIRPTQDQPPVIDTPPANYTVIEGGPATFSVTVTGTPPFTYKWFKDDVEIQSATQSSYSIAETDSNDAGSYKVGITNSVDTVTSAPAMLTLLPRVNTPVMDVSWKLAPGARPYLATDDSQRGLAYNPALDHVLVVSRTAVAGLPTPPLVVVLDAATGDEIKDAGVLRTLKLTNSADPGQDVTGGFFTLNMIGCSSDGAIYACNLATTASTFKIYRWPNDSAEAEPTVVHGPGDVLGGRMGDSFDVRGGGASTQLLIGAQGLPKFAVFTTTDGTSFTPATFEIATLPTAAFFMVAFGEGNTIWAKENGGPLRHISFDVTSGIATLLETTTSGITGAVRVVGADPANNLVGGIAVENPDNLRLYDVSIGTEPPVLLDQEFFASDNPNGNGVGSIKFGGGRVYALDANNGIIAMKVTWTPQNPDPPPELIELSYTQNDPGPDTFNFVLKGEIGKTYVLEGSPSLTANSWTGIQPITLGDPPEQPIIFQVQPGQLFYFFRARPQ